MLDLIHAWFLFPAAMVLLCAGLGLLIERAAGRTVDGVLVLPLGLAGVVAVSAVTTASAGTAKVTPFVLVLLGLAGLVLGRRAHRPALAPALTMVAVLLAFGAPVLLSGQATFPGYLRLDDTATWLAFSDQVLTAGRHYQDLPSGTFRQLLEANLSIGYPLGAFTALGAGSRIAFLDAAWAFAPYLAFCGALIAAGLWSLIAPVVPGTRLRAVVVFAAAQPALLFSYVQWGGIKEVAISGLLLVLVALGTRAASEPAPTGLRGARAAIPLGIVGASVMSIVGLGGIAFIGPVGLAIALTWLLRARRSGGTLRSPGEADGGPEPGTETTPEAETRTEAKTEAGADGGTGAEGGAKRALLGALTLIVVLVICAIPTVLQLASTLSYGKEFFDSGSSEATRLGNLAGPLRLTQLGGIWLGPDFRQPVTSAANTILLVIAALAAVWGLLHAVRSRAATGGLLLYVALSALAVGAGVATGASPWLMGKTLAIAAPTVPLLALCGGAVLAARHRAGYAVIGVLVAGIVASNVYAYTDVTLAPRDRLAELQDVAKQLEGHGPTFDNEYEVYATRHFLRDGATVQPAELRNVQLPVIDGRFLIQPAWADLDAFPPSTLAAYPSVVVSRSPTESRPSSEFERVWKGEFYDVYRRTGIGTLVRHVPLGDSRTMPYCGNSQNAEPLALCPLQPVASPTCRVIRRIGNEAATGGASLVAAVRVPPVMLRGDETRWPADWLHDPAGHVLTPLSPGVATSEVNIPTGGRYAFWLGGAFARGFHVRVDGQEVGEVRQQLGSVGAGVRIGEVSIEPGIHTIEIEYPEEGLRPGDADAGHLTVLRWFGLSPIDDEAQLLSVPADGADTLCGKSLDWIDIVR